MTIRGWLEESELNRLDAQLLLSFVIKQPKEWLLAHDDFVLSRSDLKKLNKCKKRRLNNEPIAYITGEKEFYRRNFIVTKDTLIPRPETEQIVEYCLSSSVSNTLDIGTGSGCIAITLKLENPELKITASDISESALEIAKQNWQSLKGDSQKIDFVQSDLLENITNKFDLIVANLPYVDKNWTVSPETKFEPQSALFASDNGLEFIKKLIDTAANNLTQNGILVLELDPASVKRAKEYCKNSYDVIYEKPFMLVLQLAIVR